MTRDGELLPDEVVEERGLAGVGSSDDGDSAGAGGHARGGLGEKKAGRFKMRSGPQWGAGDGLLSRDLSIGVPSAL